MNIERELGNSPNDVSSLKCGYDVESTSRDKKNLVSFIGVKGRASEASTETVTKNEILTALNSPENFILAIVTVGGNSTHVVYRKTLAGSHLRPLVRKL
ncbi:MAG: DUF3883 domain-containing protein [Selenomonadaceae bacterium]|nr:DUF3883 domain-containing protein [Selenomonadaceae bacterium]